LYHINGRENQLYFPIKLFCRQSPAEIGRQAESLLLRRMQGKARGKKPIERVVETRLVVRSSSTPSLFKGRDE